MAKGNKKDMKILVAAPLGDGKEYSLDLWMKFVEEQPVPVDVAFCVNGKNAASKVLMLQKKRIKGKTVKAVALEHKEHSNVVKMITQSREILRVKAVAENYDYIFWLDTDTIPTRIDALQQLLDTKEKFVSGLYFYKNSKVPVLVDVVSQMNPKMSYMQDYFESKKLMPILGCGFGCLLMHKDVFSNTKFVYDKYKQQVTDDFAYCNQLIEKEVKMVAAVWVVCRHYGPQDFGLNPQGNPATSWLHIKRYEE